MKQMCEFVTKKDLVFGLSFAIQNRLREEDDHARTAAPNADAFGAGPNISSTPNREARNFNVSPMRSTYSVCNRLTFQVCFNGN